MKNEIKNVTSHTNEDGIDPYNSSNKKEQRQLFLFIDGHKSPLKQIKPSARFSLSGTTPAFDFQIVMSSLNGYTEQKHN